MDPPGITRHRRPFLAPVWLSMLAVVVVVAAAVMTYRSATTTVVVLVRPAEKEMGVIADPPLSSGGEERAQRLARMFGEAAAAGRLSALYVSETRVAQQTVAPLAERLGVHPIVVPVNDVNGIAARVLREHEGGTVLVIGTNDSVPRLLRALSGRDFPATKDNEYDTVFVISIPTFGESNVLRLRY